MMEPLKGKPRQTRTYKAGRSVPAAADALGVTEAIVRSAIRLGQIKVVKIGAQIIVPHGEIARVKGESK